MTSENGILFVSSKPEKIILDTQRFIMSLAVESTWVGEKFFISAVFLGQPSVAKGHKADENQVSKTSFSFSKGILCPHQIWREIVQSRTFLSHVKYVFSHLFG